MNSALRVPAGFLFCLFVFLLASCDEGNPGDPESHSGVRMTVDQDGGHIILDHTFHAYIPEGVLSSSATLSLERIPPAAPPPEGWIQVGDAVEILATDLPSGVPLTLAMQHDYSWTGPLSGHLVQWHRWHGAEGWTAVAGAANNFPLPLTTRDGVPGRYAAHVDTSKGADGLVRVRAVVGTRHRTRDGWLTSLSIEFLSIPTGENLMDAGGTVRWAEFNLTPLEGSFADFTPTLAIRPDQELDLRVAGGEEVPALTDTIRFLAGHLEVTHPSVDGESVSPIQPLTVRWSGAAEGLVWLAVYGDDTEGEFLYEGKLIPDTGTHTLTVENLGQFARGAEVTIFLQNTRAQVITAEGFHRSSSCLVQSSASTRIRLDFR